MGQRCPLSLKSGNNLGLHEYIPRLSFVIQGQKEKVFRLGAEYLFLFFNVAERLTLLLCCKDTDFSCISKFIYNPNHEINHF
jgi:hypothetical protein